MGLSGWTLSSKEHHPCMKNAITILLVISSLTLTPKAFADERWRIYDQKGRYEATVRKNDDWRLKMYDQKGRHQRTFREDNGERMKMYDTQKADLRVLSVRKMAAV
jgi:hypothetical protein